MPMTTRHDMLVHGLRDMYHAEKQLTKALPRMARAASDDELRAAFENHLEETTQQIEKLEQIFASLGAAAPSAAPRVRPRRPSRPGPGRSGTSGRAARGRDRGR